MLDRSYHELGLGDVIPMCTVQAYNVLQLEPLFEYLASGFQNVSPIPNLINLHHPNAFRTQVLTPELKALARQSLRRIWEKTDARFESGAFGPRYRHMLVSVDEAIRFMEAEDHPELIPEFLGLTADMDRLRGQNVFKIVPELEALKASLAPRGAQVAGSSPLVPPCEVPPANA